MASNSLGSFFRITSFGESHGPLYGVVIDGCPPNILIDKTQIQQALNRRAPGNSPFTSPRQEPDQAEWLSGLFEGRSTGAPITLLIHNQAYDSRPYDMQKDHLRPGHAQYSYLQKYGIFDHRGGGRASARETVCRVAAGALANQILEAKGIHIYAYLQSMGSHPLQAPLPYTLQDNHSLKEQIYQHPFYSLDANTIAPWSDYLSSIQQEGDSVGGIVSFLATGVPAGLGDPLYEKCEACLASAMMSIPASKGFEIGEGFQAAFLKGSEHNDLFIQKESGIQFASQHSGGLLGGITTGQPLWGRVAFKAPSSIKKEQKTVDLKGNPVLYQSEPGSKHDPCVAIRAVPVVEAMCALVILDRLLVQGALLS
jgi:chorismate synthase